MKRLLCAIVIIILAVGCVTAWPDQCRVQDGTRVCTCAVLKFTIDKAPDKPSPPAGVVGLQCDGKPLPIEAHGEQVKK